MLINEGGLIRAIKRAYKAGGYTVLNTGNDVAIYTDHWFAMANRALLPRKVLATIVEHMGMIPEKDMPTSIIKDTEPQLVLRETAADDMDHWRGGDRGEEVTMVPVIMQGFQIYQPPGGGACWGVPPVPGGHDRAGSGGAYRRGRDRQGSPAVGGRRRGCGD